MKEENKSLSIGLGGILNNKNTGKKKITLIVGILLVIGIIIGTSYAFWQITIVQESNNIIVSDCLDLTLSDVTNAISLEKAYPLTDEESENLIPYEFKITNTCNTTAYYDINLEIMGLNDKLSSEYIAVKLNNKEKVILSTKKEVTPTYKDSNYIADEAYKLTSGSIKAKEKISYKLKLWMDESVENLDAMNKKFISKISVVASTEQPKKNLIEYVTNLETEEIVEDDYGNLRYIGANPNNYVSFNNELWRIIGVMKDIENPDGSKEDKVKLIRSESIGNYSWDNKPSGTGSSTSNSGSNDWNDSTLQKVLNEGVYYNRTSGDCSSGSNGATKPCDFTSNGLTEESKNMISESVWNLGGTASYTSSSNGLAKHWYSYERGSKVYAGRPTKWTGNVSLIYPSDFGYATSGGTTTDKETCLNTILYNWDGNGLYDCKNNDWLYLNGRDSEWTLSPYSGFNTFGFIINYTGYVSHDVIYTTRAVRPVVYLNSNIKIEEGNNGSSSSPFTLKS